MMGVIWATSRFPIQNAIVVSDTDIPTHNHTNTEDLLTLQNSSLSHLATKESLPYADLRGNYTYL